MTEQTVCLDSFPLSERPQATAGLLVSEAAESPTSAAAKIIQVAASGHFMPELAVRFGSSERLSMPCRQLALPLLCDRGMNFGMSLPNATEMLVHGAQMHS